MCARPMRRWVPQPQPTLQAARETRIFRCVHAPLRAMRISNAYSASTARTCPRRSQGRFHRSPSTGPWTIFRCEAMPRRSSTKSTFGAAVSSLLTERRMSQADLAEAVGKSHAYTNQTLTGRKSASPEWVNLVAETLRLSPKQRATLHRAAAKDQGYEIDLGEYRPKKR